jgi:hypothetical protein
MPGNPLVRFDEGRVGRIARCRPLSYSTDLAINKKKTAMTKSAIGEEIVDSDQFSSSADGRRHHTNSQWA